MKQIILLLFSLIIFSCSTKEEQLIHNAESYIKDSIITTINDPDSYVVVKTKITDTIKFKRIIEHDTIYINNLISVNKLNIGFTEINITSSIELIKLYKRNMTLINQLGYSRNYYLDDLDKYKDDISETENTILQNKQDLVDEKLKQRLYKNIKDTILSNINQIDTSEIALIYIKQVYRYKNTLGGVMLDTTSIAYAPKEFTIKSMGVTYRKGFSHKSVIVPLKHFRIN